MPVILHRPSTWFARHPWTWGVAFGVVVGAAVVMVSSLQHGLHASNAVLGLVVFIAFGLIGVIGAVARRYTPGGPT